MLIWLLCWLLYDFRGLLVVLWCGVCLAWLRGLVCGVSGVCTACLGGLVVGFGGFALFGLPYVWWLW